MASTSSLQFRALAMSNDGSRACIQRSKSGLVAAVCTVTALSCEEMYDTSSSLSVWNTYS